MGRGGVGADGGGLKPRRIRSYPAGISCSSIPGRSNQSKFLHLVGGEKFDCTRGLNLNNRGFFIVLCRAARCLQRCIVSRHVNSSLGILHSNATEFPLQDSLQCALLFQNENV